MKLDLNKFYNTNYKDIVHKEAVEEALRMVAEIDLKDIEIDSILSITFSVDEFGENPIYVEYLDKEGKKHIVRIRPAVTNEIQEILKRYVTLEQHETDKQDIYNHFEHMHVPMEIRSANGLDKDDNKVIVLNNDNSYLSFQVDPETDNEIQWLCIHNKGGLGPRSMYFARFMDYAKIDQVPSNAEFLEKIQQLEELVLRKSQETLQSSKAYADSQDDTLRAEITSNVINQINETKNGILAYVDVEIDNLKEYVDSRDAEYHELSKQYTDNAKQEAVNSCKTYTDTKTAETLETSKTYTDTKHTEVSQHVDELEKDMNTNFATKQELLKHVESLSEVDQQNFETLNEKINNKADKQTVDNLKEYVDSRDAEYHELSKQYTDNAKQEAVNSCKTYTDTRTAETLETSKTYTDTKHTEMIQHVADLRNDMITNFATKQELLNHVESLSQVAQQNFESLIEEINIKADKQTVDALSQLVQEIATKVDGVEIGERTKLNFALSNTNNETPINPRITSNDSYYVKVGSQYFISVYLTVEIEVIPTTTQKTVSFTWMHDLPGENPPLTLTAELVGNRSTYSTTKMVKTNRSRVTFSIPAFPATETYIENKISIYGTAITKDLSMEAENNE